MNMIIDLFELEVLIKQWAYNFLLFNRHEKMYVLIILY